MILVTGATGLSGSYVVRELRQRGLAGHFVWHDLCSEVISVTGSPCQLIHKPLAEMSDEERVSRRF